MSFREKVNNHNKDNYMFGKTAVRTKHINTPILMRGGKRL